MIISFEDELTEEIFHGIRTHKERKQFSGALVKEIERKLDLLNAIENLDELKAIPSVKADGPVRSGKNKYSIPVYNDIRLDFEWNHGGADKVEIKIT